jgi:CHASE3 domain sensor protein
MPNRLIPPLERIRSGRTIAGFALAVVAVLANAVVSYRSLQEVAENERSLLHTHQVLDNLQAVLSLLKDAETGYRGYHITNQENYLEPYDEALARIPRRLEALERSVSDNPEQRTNMRLLADQAEKILAHLKQCIYIGREKCMESL